MSNMDIVAPPRPLKLVEQNGIDFGQRRSGTKATPVEWGDVRDEAERACESVHMDYLLGICVEMSTALDKSDPARKFKGRVVFQGNRVVDQKHEVAIFQDLGSAPAAMEASKHADWYACAPGHSVKITDAEQE